MPCRPHHGPFPVEIHPGCLRRRNATRSSRDSAWPKPRKYSSEDIGKIAAQTRATHVLRGSFIKAGESFIITAGLQKPGTGESSSALRLEASNEKDIIVKVDELTRQVKEGLNLTPAQIASDIEKEAGKITTSSPEALKYYIEGRRLP